MKRLLLTILVAALRRLQPKACRYIEETEERDATCAHCGCTLAEHDSNYCREFVEIDRDCWCHPTLFFDGGEEFGNVWVHKAPSDELPPARVLIEALADAMKGSE